MERVQIVRGLLLGPDERFNGKEGGGGGGLALDGIGWQDGE